MLNGGPDVGATDRVGLTVARSAAVAGRLLRYEGMGRLLVSAPEAAEATVSGVQLSYLLSIVNNRSDRKRV